MDKEAQAYIEGKQKFLKLGDGEDWTGFFVSYKVVPDKFKIAEDPSAKTIVYKLQAIGGKDLEWTCGNVEAFKDLHKYERGQKFVVKRIGTGNKTKYAITKLDHTPNGTPTAAPAKPAAAADDEVPF